MLQKFEPIKLSKWRRSSKCELFPTLRISNWAENKFAQSRKLAPKPQVEKPFHSNYHADGLDLYKIDYEGNLISETKIGKKIY